MAFVDAILAFIVTILGFALLVTLLVNIVVRMLNLRHETLRATLRLVYLEYFHIQRAGATRTGAQQADVFATAILDYAGLSVDPDTADAGNQHALKDATEHKKYSPIDDLQPETLNSALNSPILDGKGLTLLDAGHKAGFVGFATQRFPTYAGAQGQVFAKKARRIGYCMAFSVAILFNVNGYDIYQSLVSDAAARDKVITSFQSEPFQREAGQILGDAAVEGQARRSLSRIADWGIPVGWQNSRIVADINSYRQSEGGSLKFWLMTLPFWLLNVLGTGLMIGQGAPFWYDALTKLMNLRQGGGKAAGVGQQSAWAK